jgi:hypothetical protein
MRIADDTEAIGRRYRELFRPSPEQPSPPKPEPETKSAAETMCRCGRPVSDCFFCIGSVIAGCLRSIPRSRRAWCPLSLAPRHKRPQLV